VSRKDASYIELLGLEFFRNFADALFFNVWKRFDTFTFAELVAVVELCLDAGRA
jgi:hypothetical protein